MDIKDSQNFCGKPGRMHEEVEFLLLYKHFEIMGATEGKGYVCWSWFAPYNTEKSKKYSEYLSWEQA